MTVTTNVAVTQQLLTTQRFFCHHAALGCQLNFLAFRGAATSRMRYRIAYSQWYSQPVCHKNRVYFQKSVAPVYCVEVNIIFQESGVRGDRKLKQNNGKEGNCYLSVWLCAISSNVECWTAWWRPCIVKNYNNNSHPCVSCLTDMLHDVKNRTVYRVQRLRWITSENSVARSTVIFLNGFAYCTQHIKCNVVKCQLL